MSLGGIRPANSIKTTTYAYARSHTLPRVDRDKDSERQKKLRRKFEEIIDESTWPFLSSVIMQYNTLSVLRQKEMNRRYNKMNSCFQEEGKNKFIYNHDRLMKQALMASISRHYDDVHDKSLSIYIESYLRSKNSRSE